MNKHGLLSTLSENSSADQITLWHVSQDADALKSFLNNGAQAIGTGRGGQTNGFYVWSKKEGAVSHFSDFLSEGTTGDSLLISVSTHIKKMTYPDWQFDIEGAQLLNPLLFKYKEQIKNLKNLEYLDGDGKQCIIRSISTTNYTTQNNCSFSFRCYPSRFTTQVIGDAGLNVDLFQAVIDKMCEDPNFLKDYNELLQQSAASSEHLALKYCGRSPLPINEAIYIQKDEKGKVIETPLYASSADEKRQPCPFVKMGLVRKKQNSTTN